MHDPNDESLASILAEKLTQAAEISEKKIELASEKAAQKILLTAEKAAKLLHNTVNSIWKFQIRRAISEVIEKKLGAVSGFSPLSITIYEESHTLSSETAQKLQDFWEKEGYMLGGTRALLKIEELFGNDILQDVCLTHELSYGACLLVALAAAQNKKIITFEFA